MLANQIKELVKGEVIESDDKLKEYGRDASIFEVKPEVVVKPKDAEDVRKLVKFVSEYKSSIPNLSLTARAGGSDMSGGPLNESIILDLTAHMNRVLEVREIPPADGYAVVEPGAFYRDFEKETLKRGLLMPSYPASRELCAVGGMVANNSGGEKSLRYRKTYDLLEANYDTIQKAKPNVSKNSAGYALWDVWDKKKFDLTKLFVGSQGTLGLITKIKFRLIKPDKYSKLLVIFLRDINRLPELVSEVLKFHPEDFESYDDKTLKLVI